jgi:triacylglycerol lipase
MPVLTPHEAADLADGVYRVNGNDDFNLKIFLNHRIFQKTSRVESPKIIKADVGGRLFRAAKDSFGVMASGEKDLFLIFRGTTKANNNADKITDLRIGICLSKTNLPVHIGFNQTFNSMLPEIKSFFKDNEAPELIHCIGHSLGGAVASLAADWISKNRSDLKGRIKLYTFGAPRVGTDWFANSTTSTIGDINMYRTYHRTDPVPMVAIYPFVQAPIRKPGHFLPSSFPLTSGDAHKMEHYISSVRGKDWPSISENPIEPYNLEICLENWLKSKSPVSTSDSSFWQWVNSALIYVIKKVSINALAMLQGAVIGLHTIVDKLAYILAQGINLAKDISTWVVLLMKKLMQALHIVAPPTKEELTQALIKRVLTRLTEEANKNASKAIRNL